MGKQINSPQEFAFELRDFISYNGLSGKELKSIAGSINYPLGMFKTGKRVLLTNELVFLHSYLGEVMIKHCFENLTEASLGKANHIAEIYRKNLISQWVPDSMFQDYERRLHVWDGLLLNLEIGEQYQNDLSKLAVTFYEFLTYKPCGEHNELMLTVRFHEYVKILITSIEAMIQDTAFDDK